MNLEQAIALHRLGTPLDPSNPYGRPDTQKVLEAALLRARHQTQTYVLIALLGIGLAFKTGDITFDDKSNDHIAARFLAAYFIEEPEAIHHVKDVSVTDITRSKKNHEAILAARPPRPESSGPLLAPTLTKLFAQDYRFGDEGLISIRPGELWYPTATTPDFEEFSPLLEVQDWEPPTAPLPETPDYADGEDPFSLWIAEQERPLIE